MNRNLEIQLQQWVQIDNQLKQLWEKTKELRQKRDTLESSINEQVTSAKLNDKTVEISDGKLKFCESKVAEGLTFKYLERVLGEIIRSPEQVRTIIEQIKVRRNVTVVQEIKRISNK